MASQSSLNSPIMTIDNLADNVLADILSFLDVKDKCRAAQVCRRWNSLVHQKSLWKHIDLTQLKVDLRNIWKLVRAYYTDMLSSLRLRGFVESIKNTECISNAVLADIKTRCPNLKQLYITKANLMNINSSLLPTCLKQLTLHKCMISVDWFQAASEAGNLEGLEELSLDGTTRTADATLKHIANLKQLRVVNFGGCYRIHEPGMAVMSQNLIQMEKLVLYGCDIEDQCLHHVGRYLTNLKHINLANCSQISNTGIGSLASLNKLNAINLASCNVTKQGVIDFLTVTQSNSLECITLGKDIGLSLEDMTSQLKPNMKIYFT